MDWLDLLAVQGTLKSLLQHHSSEASTFHHSAFFHVKWLHLKYWIPKILKCWWIHVKGSHLFFAKQDSNSSTSEVIMCRWVELKKWYSIWALYPNQVWQDVNGFEDSNEFRVSFKSMKKSFHFQVIFLGHRQTHTHTHTHACTHVHTHTHTPLHTGVLLVSECSC